MSVDGVTRSRNLQLTPADLKATSSDGSCWQGVLRDTVAFVSQMFRMEGDSPGLPATASSRVQMPCIRGSYIARVVPRAVSGLPSRLHGAQVPGRHWIAATARLLAEPHRLPRVAVVLGRAAACGASLRINAQYRLALP